MDKPLEKSEPSMGYFEGCLHYYPIQVFYEGMDYVDNRIMPRVGLISL